MPKFHESIQGDDSCSEMMIQMITAGQPMM